MARIVKRGKGYQIRVSDGYFTNGKQNVKTMTWAPKPGMNEKQIEKELERQAILFEDKCRGLSQSANIKFEAFAEQWIKEYAEPKLRIRTVDRYKQYTARTYAALGSLCMDKIVTRQIQLFIDNLQEPNIKGGGGTLSPKTIRGYLSFISTIFDYALKQDMLKDNPCRRISLPALIKKEHDCYTLEEAQQFLDLLKQESLTYQAFFTLAIFGGVRRAELLGLEWKDINFDSGVISIKRTSQYTKEKGIFTDTTKTEKSQRSLKLPDEVIALLRQYKVQQDQQRLKCGDQWIKSDRLFVAWNGKPMNPNTPFSWLWRFCERTGVKKVNIHSFRHLNATLLITNGVDAKTVSASLGHSQVTTTLNIYTHTFADAQAKASEAIANVLPLNKKAQ